MITMTLGLPEWENIVTAGAIRRKRRCF